MVPFAFALAGAPLVVACSGETDGTPSAVADDAAAGDAGIAVDPDAIEGADASVSAPKDAAATRDGASTKPDAGTPKADSGTPKVDGGAPKADSGTPPRDSGPPPVPNDPELDDPARLSAPFECQGTPLDAASILEHVPQGYGAVLPTNAPNWNNTRRVLAVTGVVRTCNGATGCTAWSRSTFVTQELEVGFAVDPTGSLFLSNVRSTSGQREVVLTPATSGDLQAEIQESSTSSKVRYKVRATRGMDGRMCLSLASKVDSRTNANGSVTESFDLGVGYAKEVVPRAVFPTPPGDFVCGGTPATDADIRGWFTTGATRSPLDFGTSRTLSRSCHAVTGCSEYKAETWFSGAPTALVVVANAFAYETTDAAGPMPIVNGAFTGAGTVNRGGTVSGHVTTSPKCVDARWDATTQGSYWATNEFAGEDTYH
ncbi:MAG: hypothetical protein U0169_04365 [Polyangiaceae bacterium]